MHDPRLIDNEPKLIINFSSVQTALDSLVFLFCSSLGRFSLKLKDISNRFRTYMTAAIISNPNGIIAQNSMAEITLCISLNFQVFGCLPLDWLSYGNCARCLIGHFACDVIFTTTLLKVSLLCLRCRCARYFFQYWSGHPISYTEDPVIFKFRGRSDVNTKIW